MIFRKAPDVRYSEVTPKALYLRRREFIQAASGVAVAAAAALAPPEARAQKPAAHGAKLASVKKSSFSTTEKQNSWEDVTTYNNFYEFGAEKEEPAINAPKFNPHPWTIRVEGLVKTPGMQDLDAFMKPFALEERIYRMRCVEGWSMVIPWHGFPMADLIKKLEPLPGAQ